MNNQPTVRNTFINSLIFCTFLSIIYFTLKIEPNVLAKILANDFDFLPKLIPLLIAHLIVVSIISVVFLKKQQAKLADSNLLRPKELIREQNRMKNEAFAVKSKKLFGSKAFKNDKSGLRISRNVKLLTKKTYEHIILFGPTGAGKSSVIYIPILQEFDDSSIVITDPKGELCRKTRGSLESRGYTVFHLNFNDHEQSDHYSLMANCATHDDVRKLADSIISNGSADGKEDEWGKLSKSLLVAFMLHEWDLGDKDITNVVKYMTETDPDDFDMFFTESSEAAHLEYLQVKKTMKSEGFISSVFATLQSKMQVFKYKTVQIIGSSSDFTADDLRLRKSALFVSYPEDESVIYSSYIASFFYQIFNKTKMHPSVDEGKSNGDGMGVVFLLDEFSNIGRIPEIDTLLSTIRSKRMSILLGIQSFDQLKKVYGSAVNIIVENCKTKIILPGTTGETAKFFSEIVGEEEFKQTSVSSSKKSEVSTSESLTKKMVLSQDQIRRMKSYRIIFVADNLKPVIDDKNYYYMDNIELFLFKHLPFSESRNTKIGKWVSDKLKFKQRMKKKELQQKVAEAKTERKIEIQEKRKELNVTRTITTEKRRSPDQVIEASRKNPKNQQKVERAKEILNGLDDF